MFCSKLTLLKLFLTAIAPFLFTMGHSQISDQPSNISIAQPVLEICGSHNVSLLPKELDRKRLSISYKPTIDQTTWAYNTSIPGSSKFCSCSVTTLTIHYSGTINNLDSILLEGQNIKPYCTFDPGNSKITYSAPAIPFPEIEFKFSSVGIDPSFKATHIEGGGLCVIMDVSGIDPIVSILEATIYSARMALSSPIIPIDNGLGFGLDFSAPLNKWVSLKTDFNWIGYPIDFTLDEGTPEQIELLSTAGDTSLTLQNYSLLFGPEVHVGKGKWGLDLALQGGLMVSQTPEVDFGLDTGSGAINPENTIFSLGDNQGSFAWTSSLKIHRQLSKHWGIVGEVSYLSSTGDLLQVENRAYPEAIQAGQLDPDLLSTLPLVTEQTRFKSLNLGLGIRYRFSTCKCP